jgi:hypothetical protein
MSAKTKRLGSVQAAHPNGSAGRTVLRNQVGANASARAGAGANPTAVARANASRRRRPRYQARRRLLGWNLVLLLAALVVVGLLLGSAIIGEISTPAGKIAGAQTSYNFGDVPIGGGDITTKFPLTVDGDARAIDITST